MFSMATSTVDISSCIVDESIRQTIQITKSEVRVRESDKRWSFKQLKPLESLCHAVEASNVGDGQSQRQVFKLRQSPDHMIDK